MSYNTKKTADAKKGPIDEIRVNGCKVAVWENQTDKGVRHNVTFQRSYLDTDNKWQTTDSYGLSDLLAHRAAVDLAISRLIETRLDMGPADPLAVALDESSSCRADQVGHLQKRPTHLLLLL